MSSFNTQCFLSHQTIKEGDECVLMFVRPSKGQDATGKIGDLMVEGTGSILNISEPDSYWTPQSLLLNVEYEGNGYFNILDIGNTYINAYSIVTDFFKEKLVIDAFDKEEEAMVFDFERMLENNCPGLYLELVVKENIELSKQEVMNELNIALSYIQTFSRVGQLFFPVPDMRGLVTVLTSPMHKSAYEYLLTKAEDFERQDGFTNDISGKIESLLEDLERAVAMKTLDSVKAVNHLHTSMPIAETKIFNMLTEHLVNQKIKLSTEHAKNLFSKYFEMSSLLESMEIMNLKITPQIYSSDSSENESGKEFINFTKYVSDSLSNVKKLKI